jgi:tRNA pseudouridine13 synthase
MLEGLFERAIEGDVMRKEDSGGLFRVVDAVEESRRMASWEISPTGPMFGARMQPAEAAAAAREHALFERWGLAAIDQPALRKLAPGTRRVARVRPGELSVKPVADGLVFGFELPAGAYATVVLREFLKPGDTRTA